VLGHELLLPGPLRVVQEGAGLAASPEFLGVFATSIVRYAASLTAGFLLAVVTGSVAAGLPFVDRALSPILSAVRATPVISIILLAIIWLSPGGVPVLVALLVAFPLIHDGIRDGIRRCPSQLRELAAVFSVPPLRRLGGLVVPSAVPSVLSAARGATGMGWKAIVAAEVLSQPQVGLGTELHLAKLYLQTPRVLAWTVWAVLFAYGIDLILSAVERRTARFALSETKAGAQQNVQSDTLPNGKRNSRSDVLNDSDGSGKQPAESAGDTGVAVSVKAARRVGAVSSGNVSRGEVPESFGGALPESEVAASSASRHSGVTVALEEVTFGYGEVPVLDGVSARVPAGRTLLVSGPSGIGKSTLLHLAAGLLCPRRGSVIYQSEDGQPVKPTVAAVFQEARLLPWKSVAGNVRWAAGTSSPAADEWVRAVGLPPEAFPHELSGGMKRRAALARALAATAQVLLLDEPFSGQDAVTKRGLVELLSRYRSRYAPTVILVAHDQRDVAGIVDERLSLR